MSSLARLHGCVKSRDDGTTTKIYHRIRNVKNVERNEKRERRKKKTHVLYVRTYTEGRSEEKRSGKRGGVRDSCASSKAAGR